MAYETLTKQRPFVKAKNLKKGDKVEGYVLGKWTSEKYPDHVNMIVSVVNDGQFMVDQKDGDAFVQVPVAVKAGQEIILQGGGNLKYFFANNNPVGAKYCFTYEGKIIKKKGRAAGKEAHYFTVQVDREDHFKGELPATEAETQSADIAF